MSEPAKDEAELIERMAKAMHDSVYSGQSAWMDASKFERLYREREADAALAAIRAAGWAVVPARLTKDMEYDALRAENARLREALQHADAALDSLMSDEMPYTESCRIWRTAAESIRAALEVKP
jgi:hypothetical protein